MAASTLDPDNVPEGRRPKGTDELVGDINMDENADRVVGADEAGLGDGLDQAEEARKKRK